MFERTCGPATMQPHMLLPITPTKKIVMRICIERYVQPESVSLGVALGLQQPPLRAQSMTRRL